MTKGRQTGKQFGFAGTRTSDSRSERLEIRSPLPRILIVCEGEKTEPNYFHQFRVTNDVFGAGLETIRVVEEAERLYEKDGPFDQVWCVFDRDSFPADRFDNAISKVQSREHEGFHVAYTNEAFELWYLLHFEYQDAALHRSSYKDRLSKHLGRAHEKNDPEIYALLQTKGDEELATRYAQRLRNFHADDVPCSRQNPVTTVDKLVQVLRQIQRQHSF